MKKVDLIVGVVEANERAADVSMVTSIVDQYNSNSTGYKLVVESAQTSAASSNIVSIAASVSGAQSVQRVMPSVNLVGLGRWLGASVPFFGITTNSYAGSVTFLKITADVFDDDPNTRVQIGDVFSLISNVSGVVLSVAVLGASPGVVAVLAGISFVATAGSILSSDSIRSVYEKLVKPVWDRYAKENPSSNFSESVLAPDLTIVSPEELFSSYGGMTPKLVIDSDGGDVSISSIKLGYDNFYGGLPYGGYASPWVGGSDEISVGEFDYMTQSQNSGQGIPVIDHEPVYVNPNDSSGACVRCHEK